LTGIPLRFVPQGVIPRDLNIGVVLKRKPVVAAPVAAAVAEVATPAWRFVGWTWSAAKVIIIDAATFQLTSAPRMSGISMAAGLDDDIALETADATEDIGPESWIITINPIAANVDWDAATNPAGLGQTIGVGIGFAGPIDVIRVLSEFVWNAIVILPVYSNVPYTGYIVANASSDLVSDGVQVLVGWPLTFRFYDT
jgi:hypothetical protein